MSQTQMWTCPLIELNNYTYRRINIIHSVRRSDWPFSTMYSCISWSIHDYASGEYQGRDVMNYSKMKWNNSYLDVQMWKCGRNSLVWAWPPGTLGARWTCGYKRSGNGEWCYSFLLVLFPTICLMHKQPGTRSRLSLRCLDFPRERQWGIRLFLNHTLVSITQKPSRYIRLFDWQITRYPFKFDRMRTPACNNISTWIYAHLLRNNSRLCLMLIVGIAHINRDCICVIDWWMTYIQNEEDER